MAKTVKKVDTKKATTKKSATKKVAAKEEVKQVEAKAAKKVSAKKETVPDKTEAEAKKIAGVDSKNVEANTENLIQATNNEKIRRGLILANIRYQDAMEELTRNRV